MSTTSPTNLEETPLTAPPDDKQLDPQALEAQHQSGVYGKRDICLVKGRGARVWDSKGREYLDFAAGIGTLFLGHCHPAVVDAIRDQSERIISTFEGLYSEARGRLLGLLAEVTPAHIERFFMTNSGTEAFEAALKFSRLATGRTDFVCFEKAFHGRTFGSLSATMKPAYHEGFRPMVPGFTQVPFNDTAALEAAVTEQTAAILFEPIQGEGGVNPMSHELAAMLTRLQRERGVLLVVDEIQTGFCRTGRWFAHEEFGVKPDFLVMAKAMGGGVPIGALGIAGHLEKPRVGCHGSTYGGTPLMCAAAEAAIRAMRDDRLAERAAEKGERFMGSIRALKLPAVQEVRGRGLMIGLRVDRDLKDVLAAFDERGFLALRAGEDVLRLLPPVVATDDDFAEALSHLKDVLG